MHSSLPSPPASTPHEIPGTPVRIQEPADLLMDTDTPTNHSRLFASPQPSNGLLTPFSKHSAPDTYLSTPTFASLSSQPNTPSGRVYIIPDSPPFNALVQGALKTSKSTNHQTTHHDDDTFDSFRSDGSSQEFVLNQLTQGMDEENNGILQEKSENESMVIDDPPLATSLSSRDNEALAYSRSPPQRNPPAQDNLGLLSPTRPSLQLQTIFTPFAQSDSSPTYLQSPTYSIGLGSPVIRQSWYQAPRRRRSSKKMSGSEAQTSPVQPLVADVTVAPPAEPKPRVLQSEPAITLAASPSPLISEPDQFTPRTQYSWMQSDSQVTGSYPPLQTQAPYRSQSMSQD
ncbi:hypothetical protein P691DRAFT_118621 [Macrolepiota fuliginosa MF-IS2]|uniref:Uncharacterized protein n=1 Tax=Macrolepiota fuliginosa MF-IS2 TaxID=1400762 RepID=A0A9P6C9C4_9AGAR|nr:hypothetical protein P691DRAFT_118621 [Macrolepiota fuliginosa MF-IS2]